MRKITVSLSILILTATTLIGFLYPRTGRAEAPVIDVANLSQNTTETITQRITKALEATGYALVRNVMNAVLGKLAYDTATWIASAGSGQQPLVFTQKPGEYIKDMGDAAAGGVLDAFAQGFGFDAAKLCEPSSDAFKIRLGLSLERIGGTSYYKPTCTGSEIFSNWKEVLKDPSFGKYIDAQWDPNANPLGQAIMATSYLVEMQTEAAESSKLETQWGQFKAKTETISGYILTPGKMVEQEWVTAEERASSTSFQMLGSPLADSASIFMNTLISKLSERIQQGFLSPSGTDLGELIAGSTGGTTSGIKAAKAVYASLAKPNFITSGTYDVLTELSSCPTEGATSNNCVMGSTLQVAVENKWTVQEFLDYMSEVMGNTEYKFAQDEIGNPEEGLTYRGIMVLKKYRIVPVGWQLAAEFIRSEILSEGPSLKQIADCYYACGGDPESVGECQYLHDDQNPLTTDTYSPFCKLIDPNWVLKAPENYCERQAPGPDIVYESFNDDDSLIDTLERRTISRSSYCADNRGCIQEEKEGVCTAYGYCSAEKRIYRSAGSTCDESMASCQTFSIKDGENEGDTVSYLKSTLNYNDCATDPGCKWYCLAKDAGGAFICKDKDTVYDICDSTDVPAYHKDESCSCSVSETCWIPAGSGGGDPNQWRKCELGSCSDTTKNTKSSCESNNSTWTGSGAICDLGDNCGASNITYNPNNQKCLCTAKNSCNVNTIGGTTCTYTYPGGATIGCTLSNGCTDDDATYSYNAYCSASNVGDSCAIQPGQTECVNDLGNTCTLGSCTLEYCPCTVGSASCNVPEGSAFCTSADGKKVILGTKEENDPTLTPYGTELVYNVSINLDRNLKECDSEDASCTQYIRTLPNTNLLYNSNFKIVQGAADDAGQDFFGAYAKTGLGCSQDGDPASGACIGWKQEGLSAYGITTGQDTSLYTGVTSAYGQAIILPAGSGKITNSFNTGHALANRTFTFTYEAMALYNANADVSFRIESSGDTGVNGPSSAQKYGTSFATYTHTYTFPDNVSDTTIKVYINAASDQLAIDAAQLNETDSYGGILNSYGTTNVVYQKSNGLSCATEDIGCELYTPQDQDASPIPAQITNRYEEACGNGTDFSGLSCNQCDGTTAQGADYYVGCDYYQEMPLNVTTPLDEYPTFSLSDIAKTGVAQRTGYYCAETQTSCLPGDTNACAGHPGDCVNNISLIPKTAEECSASSVGCEEYTNMDVVAAGGEGLEYYSYIRPCVDPSDPNVYTYHTWEGSDTEGYAMVLYKLKKSNADAGPCTNLDLSSQSSRANCADDMASNVVNCENVYGQDPDCVKFFDDQLNTYYRYASRTISVSDNCKPLRASLDQRVYYSILEESKECGADSVGCREYQGALSGDVSQLINEDFSKNTTEGWAGSISTSNESLFKDDYSLRLDGADAAQQNTITYNLYRTYTAPNGVQTNSTDMSAGATYILSFWAKGDGNLQAYLSGLSADYYFTESGSSPTPVNLTIGANWKYYVLGPVYLPTTENVNTPTLKLSYTGNSVDAKAYVDNIILEKSNSQYLIKGSFDICPDYEGCRSYEDRAGNIHYLKSFKRLCEEGNVGCEALINTANSSSEFTTRYLTENEYPNDDVVVPYDQVQAMIYSTDAVCDAASKGCTVLGLPDINEQSNAINTMGIKYGLLDPDQYQSTLCEDPQLSCREYYSSYDGTVYFKDPGERLCEYKSYIGETGVQTYGWFKKDSDETKPDCPKQYDYADPSQPLGALCNSNSQEKAGKKCVNDNDCYPASWVLGNGVPRCVSTALDDIDQDTTDVYSLDHNKDFGWAGLCPEENSGCSEYIDPNSPNIEEKLYNGGFEDNAKNNISGLYFTEGSTPDNLPDYWEAWEAYDSDANGAPNWTEDIFFTQDADVYYEGANSLKFLNNSQVQSGRDITVSRDKLYTLELYFRIPQEAQKDPAVADDYFNKISVGAVFNSSPDQNFFVAEDLIVESGDYKADEEAVGYSDWLRLSANIGLGATMEIPANAEAMRLIIFVDSAGTVGQPADRSIWFDGLSFKENDKYYMLDYTVDGTKERETVDNVHTCIDQDTEEEAATIDGSCVAFRDTLLDAQNYTQLTDEECSACAQTPNSDSCRGQINACDTNSVLKVKRDRVCKEWMACDDGEMISDEEGNLYYTCVQIPQPCVKMNEKGICIKWNVGPAYENLNSETDLSYYVRSGDTDSLYNMQNLTGYVKAGLTWGDYLTCAGGTNAGDSCNGDDNCANGTCSVPFTVQGYYPYGWMYEAGDAGAESGKELIEFGNFEDLFCAGNRIKTQIPCTANAVDTGNKGNCWQLSFQTFEDDEIEDNEAVPGLPEDGNLDTADYFCPNSPVYAPYFPFMNGQYTTGGWGGYNATSNSEVHVTQYDNEYEDNLLIDINNVLQVDASSGGSGVKYDLRDIIQQGGSYTLSLKGRFTSGFKEIGGSNPSLIGLGLKTNNIVDTASNAETENIDWFVKGQASADIVFIIDSSASMETAIANVKTAAPALASALSSQGLDARFAIVNMEKSGEALLFNNVYLDFTNDLNEFATAVGGLSLSQKSVDPPTAVIETINNELYNQGSLSYREYAERYIILVTDTDDEIPDNGTGISEAAALAATANIPIVVITQPNCANRDDCKYADYYSPLAANSGGYVLPNVYSSDWNSLMVSNEEGNSVTLTQRIANTIIGDTIPFQFNNTLKEYVFGPIQITQRRPGDNEKIAEGRVLSTDLIIQSNDNVSFQIDDVSLLPALEVNKDLDLVSRSCRAYSSASDVSCNYTEPNGVQHKGWMGYCLEADPENPSRCITWWPVDALTGEASLYARQQGGYSDRVNVYTCLVAKGYERVGFCDNGANAGEGVLCQPNNWDDPYGPSSTCGGGRCFYGADYVIMDDKTAADDGTSCDLLAIATAASCTGCGMTLGVIGCPQCVGLIAAYIAQCTSTSEENGIDNPYQATYTTDPGECTILDDNDVGNEQVDCVSGWPGEVDAHCVDENGADQASITNMDDCEAAEYIWSTDGFVNVFDKFRSTGVCLAYDNPEGFGDGTIQKNADPDYSYCFYDGDGDGIREIRSTRTCGNEEACKTSITTAGLMCAPMKCLGSVAVGCNPDNKCKDPDTLHEYTGEYQVKTRTWQMHDPYDAKDTNKNKVGGYDHGVISKLNANPVEKNINIKEIERIDLYLGDAGKGSSKTPENIFWGQGTVDDSMFKSSEGKISITNLEGGLIPDVSEEDATKGPWDKCKGLNQGDAAGVGCYWYGQYDSQGKEDNINDHHSDPDKKYDLVYVWGFSSFSKDGCHLGANSDHPEQHLSTISSDEASHHYLLDSECVEDTVKYVMDYDNGDLSGNDNNPWNHLNNVLTGLGSGNDAIVFDRSAAGSWGGWETKGNNRQGGNIYSVWLDFDANGYLQRVYTMVYYATEHVKDSKYGVEITRDAPISMTYYLRESCAVVAPMVNIYGDTVSWAYRASGEGVSSFNGFSYGDSSEPWGAISPLDKAFGSQWDSVDETVEDNQYLATAYGQQPIVLYAPEDEIDDFHGGTPYSCIGECDERWCVGGDDEGIGCDSAGDCKDGICMGVGKVQVSGLGLSTSYNVYDRNMLPVGQLQSVSKKGQDNLEHVFADMSSNPWKVDYTDTANQEELYGIYSADPDLWDYNIFKNMSVCTDNTRAGSAGNDNEYCGVRPTISDVAIDGQNNYNENYVIVPGQTVDLTFTSNVNEEQTELRKVYIDWGDGSTPLEQNWDAMPGEHKYYHAYNYCESLSCTYLGRIIITDNWGWCSGSITGTCSIYGEMNGKECQLMHPAESMEWSPVGSEAEHFRYNSNEDETVLAGCKSYDSFPFVIEAKEQE